MIRHHLPGMAAYEIAEFSISSRRIARALQSAAIRPPSMEIFLADGA